MDMQPHQKRQANCGAFHHLMHFPIGYVRYEVQAAI
jgi:hypothetical protein